MRNLGWALLALSLAPLGCDDGGNSATAPTFEVPDGGTPERTTSAELRLDEQQIGARFEADQTLVSIAVSRIGDRAVQAKVKVELIDLRTGEVVGATSADFEIDADLARLEVALDFALGEDAVRADSANYIIKYRVANGRDALWGRRALFQALDFTAIQFVGAPALQVGVPNYLRVVARDPRSGVARANTAVTISLARDTDDGVSLEPLFEGQTDQFGNVSARIEANEAQVGDARIVVEVAADGAPERIEAPVAIERAGKVLLTTDKPIYQPGQQIHLRALALQRPSLRPDADRPVIFEIYDGKDNKVERFESQTNAFGVASMTFQLAGEVNMGTYRIVTTVGDTTMEKTVKVDRYSLPKFDLDLTLDSEVYLAGEQLEGTLKARYFFGQTVEGGTVRIVASTLDVGETVFAELQGVTDAQGRFQFELPMPQYIVGLPLEQGGGLVQLAIEVTDTAGQARSIVKSVRIAQGALQIALVPESGRWVPGLENRFFLRALDVRGRPTIATHTLRIGGVEVEPFETDANGNATVRIDAEGAALAIEVESVDEAGNAVSNTFNFAPDSPALDGVVLIRADQPLHRVGDTLVLTIETLGAPDRIYLDVIRDGQTVLTDTVAVDAAGQGTYELDLSADHAGTLQIDAWYLAQGSSLRRDSTIVYVDRANGLDIEITTDRDVYAPGDEAILTFQVTDANGEGQPTALGVQIVDEAVFGLLEFRPGLEKTYFEIEGALAQPRIQIGVPSLATIASEPGAVDDPERQDDARVLFAASGDAGAGLRVDTWRQVEGRAMSLARAPVAAAVEGHLSILQLAASTGIITQENIAAHINAGFAGTPYDPWGRSMKRWMAPDAHTINFVSAGFDEAFDTWDDVRVDIPIWTVIYGDSRDDDVFGAVPEAGGENEFDQAGGEGEGEGEGDGEAAGPRVRREFPETLLVEPSLITDDAGRYELNVPLADSITTWRLTAMGNSASGLLGSTQAGILVFQDFFVDIDFPATLTRGDEYSVPVAIYNYLDVPQEVRLQVQDADWLTLLGPAEQVIELGPGEVKGIRLPVRVEQVGRHALTVFAFGSELQDAVERRVLVQPDGERVVTTQNGKLDEPAQLELMLPLNAIEGSGKTLVKLYPGLFSAVIEGMDGLLRMPSGCFEQTSSSTWPNVLVAKYLEDSDAGSPEVLLKANQFINTGYQRLLTFEVQGGGFEWFGNDPPHEVLTAYGLLEFTDMATVRVVDAAMIARTRAWLLGRQQGDGHWESARGLDETGLLSDPVTITAYVAFALAASGEAGPEMARAKAYLEAALPQMGTYTLALTGNFLVAYEPDGALTGRVVTTLAEAVTDGLDHWETDEQTTTYGLGEPAFIETTALATHALLKAGAQPAVTQAALDWLITKKNPSGAWGSTAGTVWTIKCMLVALSAGQDADADGTVRIMLDGVERASFALNPENSDVMRQADLSAYLVPGEAQALTISIEGQGNLQYGVVQQHHVPWADVSPEPSPLSLEISYDRTTLQVDDMVTATVRLQNADRRFADQVMVDLGIPPGFDLVREDLDALVEQQVFARWESTQRQLVLYFTFVPEGEAIEFSYRLIARDPIRAEAPVSRIYSYYNPEVGSAAEPIEFEVQ